jgi:hypothetical protein
VRADHRVAFERVAALGRERGVQAGIACDDDCIDLSELD